MIKRLINIIGLSTVFLCATVAFCEDGDNVGFRFEGAHVPEILVEARIVAVKETKKSYFSNTAVITHVYKGPADLLKKRFVFESNLAGGSHTSDEILHRFKIGNIFIIPLKRNTGQLVPDRLIELVSFFAMKGVGKPFDYYSCMLKKAQAIETIAAAEPDKRLGLTKEYLSSADFYVSEFAANVICNAKPDGWLKFFAETQSAGKLGLGAEIVYAEAMFREDPTLWRVSEKRRAMMKKWVSGKYSERDFERISVKLSSYFGWAISDEEYIACVRIAVENDSMPDRALGGLIMELQKGLSRSDAETAIFDLLVELIGEDKPERIRRSASSAILVTTRKRWGHSEPVKYSEAQVSTLKTLSNVEKDEKVKKKLLEAIENSEALPADSDKEGK